MVRAALVYLAGVLFWCAPFLPQSEGQFLQHRRGAFRATGGATYLLEEDFEETGTPTSATWSAIFGTPDYDATGWDGEAVSLSGTEAFRVSGITGGTDWYMYCEIQVGAASGNVEFFAFQDSGNADRLDLEYRSGGGIRVESAGTNGTVGATLSTATTYSLWIEYEAGSGADGVARLYYSTSPGTKTLQSSVSGTSATQTVEKFQFDNLTNGLTVDNIKISATPIGTNP